MLYIPKPPRSTLRCNQQKEFPKKKKKNRVCSHETKHREGIKHSSKPEVSNLQAAKQNFKLSMTKNLWNLKTEEQLNIYTHCRYFWNNLRRIKIMSAEFFNKKTTRNLKGRKTSRKISFKLGILLTIFSYLMSFTCAMQNRYSKRS